MEKVKYLIIGNSAGGIAAAEAIRQVDKTGAISMITDEPYPAYSRPLISEYLGKICPLERMLFRSPDFYQRNNIQTRLGTRVERLDVDKRAIQLEDGRRIGWEKLLLATGSLPIVPEIKGVHHSGVFTFTTLTDAAAIDQFLERSPKRTIKAVVIGGGLIGISVTEALVKRGVKVTIVEMKERILNTILDEEASALEEESLIRDGVEIMTGHTVTEVNSYSRSNVTSVTLGDDRPVPCDLVIVAIGVRPRAELASAVGIRISRGIVVDRHMATSSPDVYACGDAAEAHDFVYGENRLTPNWPSAYIGGRVAGFNMAGTPTEYQGGTAMNSVKYFGLAVVSAGMVTPLGEGYEVIREKHDHTYKKVVLRDGLVVGMVFAGDIEKAGIVFNLMKDRVNAEGFKQTLVADDFGLACLPEEIGRKSLEMPSPERVAAATLVH